MIEKAHNEKTKKFMQNILLFIDSVLVNASSSEPQNVNNVLVGGILNVRDAILSEIVRDNQIIQINQLLQNKANKKNEEKDLNQEVELEKGQQA